MRTLHQDAPASVRADPGGREPIGVKTPPRRVNEGDLDVQRILPDVLVDVVRGPDITLFISEIGRGLGFRVCAPDIGVAPGVPQ
ncbi:Uncharacterised protein [Mycobacteroides abscessus subsp. abscessus]|nr:Uncharacterised protein [Mycobacteroides abscessus subsp. abscessus]